MSPAGGASARARSVDEAGILDSPQPADPGVGTRHAVTRRPAQPGAGDGRREVPSAAAMRERADRTTPRAVAHPPRTSARVEEAPIRSGIRLNGVWCAVLLVAGVAAALALAGALSWKPGVPTTVAVAAVGVGVALLAGRGGGFEAGVLPGTVVIVVGALIVALDPGALGGAVAGPGPISRVWQAIGLLAPAAAATWVCALVTLALRRTGLLRRF